MNYLVTGGAGFIGSSIARELISNNHDVTVVDNLKTGSKDNIPDGCNFIQTDLRDDDLRKTLPSQSFSAIFHLGAQSSGEISFDDPQYDLKTNALGTLNLLQWAKTNNCSRFLYASSMGVYGSVPDKPIDESHTPAPKSFYGVSKLAGEHYTSIFNSEGLNTTCFRMFNVYGPGQNLGNMKQGMVSIYLSFLLNEDELLVKGSKDRFRDFIYIDDVVSAWITALDNPDSYGEIYNLGSGKKRTVEELVEVLKEVSGKEQFPTKFTDGTPGDQFGIYADISKIRSELTWEPEMDLRAGLQQMVQSERKNHLREPADH